VQANDGGSPRIRTSEYMANPREPRRAAGPSDRRTAGTACLSGASRCTLGAPSLAIRDTSTETDGAHAGSVVEHSCLPRMAFTAAARSARILSTGADQQSGDNSDSATLPCRCRSEDAIGRDVRLARRFLFSFRRLTVPMSGDVAASVQIGLSSRRALHCA
jgi:hypothetical protein